MNEEWKVMNSSAMESLARSMCNAPLLAKYSKTPRDLEFLTKQDSNVITDIKVVIPEKVVLVKFADDKEYKMVCDEKYDTFSLERALYLALAKHKDTKKEYTPEGIEHLADELKYKKKYVKYVKDGLKLYSDKRKAWYKEKEDAEMLERKRAKRRKKKAERAERKREEQINIQKEAYVRAMKEMQENSNE